MVDLAKLRSDTPGVSNRLHLDNCGSSFMPLPVINAMKEQLNLEIDVGGYVAQERVSDRMERVYSVLASLFGGDRHDYAFTGSAVDAWVRAFYSVPMEAGDNIVTSYNEYCANFVAYIHQARKRGIEIRIAKAGLSGCLDPNDVEKLIDDRTKLISLSHVPSSSGQINPVRDIGKIAKRNGVPFLLDACQSVGQIPLNVVEIGCDMMTGTGRKFLRGPRGTGFLYMNENMRQKIDPVFLTNGSARWSDTFDYELRRDTRLFEGWERSVMLQLGFLAALEYFQKGGVEALTSRVASLAKRLRSGLADLKNTMMTCPEGSDAAIITFNIHGHDPKKIKSDLERENIAVQIASVEHTRLDLSERNIDAAIRVSPHYYNSEDEIDRFIARIAEGFLV